MDPNFDSTSYKGLYASMETSFYPGTANPYHSAVSTSSMDSFPSPNTPSSGHPSPSVPGLGVPAEVNSPTGSGRGTSPGTGTGPAASMTTTVPAACLACRGKHLKCDGQSPCSRCQGAQAECIYVASRRGYKGPRRGTAANPNKRHASSSPPLSTNDTCPMLLSSANSTPMSAAVFSPVVTLGEAPAPLSFPATAPNNNLQIYRTIPGGVDFLSQLSAQQQIQQPPVQSLAERCLDSFYHHFHAAHPFVLPKAYLLRYAKQGGLDHLLAAVRWIGSLYIDVGPARNSLFEEAYRLAYAPNRVQDAFLVQALLLLTLGLDGSCQQEKARAILSDVERMAVHIALNTRPFATHHGRGDPVLEESWRRTWWDLFVADGMIAGVHRMTNFLLFDVPTDVALPCEEHQYMSGHIPQIPASLEDIEDRDFSGNDREFSSFAYRVMAARNLGKFMRTPPIFGPEDENLARIEALLTNWRMHLPADKRDALCENGQLDEMIFQGHMMTFATSILLHQPHSQLDSSPAQGINSCAPHRPVTSGDAFNTHTRHTITSANEISRLVTHRVPLTSHTHFFICVVTLSSIVHLSKWALFFVQHDDDDLRQLIRLNMGALAGMSRVWKASHKASAQVRGVAQEIYATKKAQQLANPTTYWLGMTQEEVASAVSTDDTIINEIELTLGAVQAMAATSSPAVSTGAIAKS